jgi:hypothetical protein
VTVQAPAKTFHDPKVIIALRRFAISITVFNIIGYTVLGFEQPWVYPFIALLTGYTTEIVLEIRGARGETRAPRFVGGGVKGVLEFLYPAHITSLALNMLIYVNDRWWVLVFGVFIAVSAKWVLRAPVKGKLRHYMNPSNFGLAMMLVLFPAWLSIAPPYHFSEYVGNFWSWFIVGAILVSGTMLNAMLTNRMWLIFGWLSFFVLQAFVRGWLFGTSIPGALAMGTGIAFVLYTNYMVTDPGTSPSKPWSQFAFGSGIATAYAFLMVAHIAYGLFFATAAVCAIRGGFLWGLHFVNKAKAKAQAAADRAVVAPVAPVPSVGPETQAA